MLQVSCHGLSLAITLRVRKPPALTQLGGVGLGPPLHEGPGERAGARRGALDAQPAWGGSRRR